MIGAFLVHDAVVETYLGASPTGDAYAAAVTVRGFLDDGLVRVQSAQGEQLVQKSVFYAPLTFSYLGVSYDSHDVFKPESRVTVNGRASQVTAVRRREGGPVFGLVEHVEVDLA